MSNIATVYSTLSNDCAVEYFMHYYLEMRREKLKYEVFLFRK